MLSGHPLRVSAYVPCFVSSLRLRIASYFPDSAYHRAADNHASLIGEWNIFELPWLMLDAWVTLGVVQHGIENGDKPVKFGCR